MWNLVGMGFKATTFSLPAIYKTKKVIQLKTLRIFTNTQNFESLFMHWESFSVNKKCLQSFIALNFLLYCSAQLQGVSNTLIWLYFDLRLTQHDIIGQWVYGNPCNWNASTIWGMCVWYLCVLCRDTYIKLL